MRKLCLYITLFFVLFSIASQAQITVTYPSNRVVFQRDNNNQASVTVAGYFDGCIDRIEARFVPREAGQGTAAPVGGGWSVIQNNPVSGNFHGVMPVTGGWYKLEVRGILDNAEAYSASVERVGIGEVFVVAGQSNATGGDGNANGPGAMDDRVSSVNFQNYNGNNNPSIQPYLSIQLPCPEFVHLDDITKTSPFGNYAWCWGAFGDSLVKKLQVPVMIFNAGWSSTGVRNWKETISETGLTTSDFGFEFPAGLPFGHLRLALNNYVAQLGVRAVLWHQGETDNLANRTREAYLSDIREVITATRNLTGKSNLAWLVSRASRFTVNGASRTWQPVIDAQNDVIGLGSNGADPAYKLANVFAGPETDSFFDASYRSDLIHFTGTGLLHLAGWWAEKLDNNFFQNSTPYLATPPPNVLISRTETTSITLEAPTGWNGYNWLANNDCNNATSTSQVNTANAGDFTLLKVTDGLKNTILSAKMKAPAPSSAVALAANLDASQKQVKMAINDLMVNDCKILAKISPAANSTIINETVTAKAYIDATVQSYQKAPYVTRHFDIRTDPANTNLASRITLFFTQAEFDAFNATSTTDIPANPDDQTGKNNVRVINVSGTSTSASAAQDSYSGTRSEITPASVQWNTTLNSWEVAFDAVNPGGFFLGSTTPPLPVILKSFTATAEKTSVELKWETTEEENSAYFELERGTDAIQFQTIAKQIAAGNSKTSRKYSYLDFSLLPGIYYYRLKQVDLDGTFAYSRIISLKLNEQPSVTIFPNPVTDQLNIQSEIEINSVEIFDLSGLKVTPKITNPNLLKLDMSKFPSGLYVIKVNNEAFKIIKK